MQKLFIAGGLLLLLSACGSTGQLAGLGGGNDFATPQQHLDGGRFDAAIAGYTSLIKSGRLSDAELEVAYINRGSARHSKQTYDEAIQDFTRAITLNERSVAAHHNRAVCYQKTGRYEEAIAGYGQAIAIDPNFDHAYAKRCELYAMAWRYDDAIADCSSSSRLAPSNANRIHSLGRLYLASGQRGAALREYRRALAVDPGLLIAREDLIRLEGDGFSTGSINESPRSGANMTPPNEAAGNAAVP